MRLHGARVAPVTTAVAGAVSAAVGVAAERDGSAPAAALAVVVVLAFFWTGALPLLLVGGKLSLAGVGFLVLMMTYTLRLVGLVLVMSLAARSGAVDVRWLAGTLIACVLVWVISQAALVGRSREPL